MSLELRDRRHRRGIAAVLVALALLVVPPAPEAGAQTGGERPAVSLSLRDCLAMAMDNNLDIAVQRYEVEVGEEGIDTARSAYDSTLTSTIQDNEVNFQSTSTFSASVGGDVIFNKTRRFTSTWNDPTIWGGNFNLYFQTDKTVTDSLFATLNPQYQGFLNFTYTQSLLRNLGLGVNQAPIQIAQNNLEISGSQFRDTVQNTVQQTEFAYWDLVFARLDLDVKRTSLKLAEELLAMNRAKVEVGTLAPIDVTQAEAGVASREEDVIVAEAAVENAEDVLRQLVNPPSDSRIWTSAIVPSDSPSFQPMAPDMQSAIETAKKNRPDLEQQRLTIKRNTLQEMVDRKARRWDLELEARYNLEGLAGRQAIDVDGDFVPDLVITDDDLPDALSELDDTQFADWALQASLTIPIGNRAARARHATSRLRREQSEVTLHNVELAAEIDVRRKVRDVATNVKRVEAARKNRELQEKNVDAEQKKYENGMSTSFQVLQVQEDLATAEISENLAIIDYMKSLVSLEQSKGTLLEARKIQMASVDRQNDFAAPGTASLAGVGLEAR